MFEQFNQPVFAFGKQLAESGLKAQQIALQNFEQVAHLQLKALETRVNATFAFLGEAAEVRDFEGVKAIFPKGVSLVKEAGEQAYAVGQEALSHTVKASEAIGNLVKSQVEAANESLKAAPVKAARAK